MEENESDDGIFIRELQDGIKESDLGSNIFNAAADFDI